MNFTYKEITHSDTAMKNGISNKVPYKLMDNMLQSAAGIQKVRDLLGVPVIPTSWFRSPELNAKIGGVNGSHHMLCLAVDFRLNGMPLDEAFMKIGMSGINFDQLILYKKKGFIHISFHPQMRGQMLEK